eukprot:910572-Lingulodinium_polyedra.AAC.1
MALRPESHRGKVGVKPLVFAFKAKVLACLAACKARVPASRPRTCCEAEALLSTLTIRNEWQCEAWRRRFTTTTTSEAAA